MIELDFDYSDLLPDVAEQAKNAADVFRRAHSRMVSEILTTGALLLGVKKVLPHGKFGPWLRAEFGAEARTAQNYMNVALHFGDKTETISHLPLTTAYALAAPSLADHVRKDVIRRLEDGEDLGPKAVRKIIASTKAEKKRAGGASSQEDQHDLDGTGSADSFGDVGGAQEKNATEAATSRLGRRKAAIRAVQLIDEVMVDRRECLLDAVEAAGEEFVPTLLCALRGQPLPEAGFQQALEKVHEDEIGSRDDALDPSSDRDIAA